jgi:hypothetical protein
LLLLPLSFVFLMYTQKDLSSYKNIYRLYWFNNKIW